VTSLFSTHPSTAERVRRLEQLVSVTPHAPKQTLGSRLAS